ncbi:hypothetical protein [Chitinophaga tropicalis]|uniref:Uncharacterized protein n=1 Tax=Chitinophaga tropicalis TaxID=2683588 RepID=A0A7K1TY74_9BACT|nr:hypothetical protein [Chitinophaga tropicalis]MVT07057.1 hypothetical protein [Chitinophaga tropicalis]
MKRLLIGAVAVLFMTSAAFAQEKKEKSKKEETASCCKKDKDAKACCKQPSKTASLRTKPKVMQNAKPAGK